MTLNDLLQKDGIDPAQVIVLRHRPPEPQLNRVFPWLAAERHDLFNAFQQTQKAALERAMLGAGYIASFIRWDAGKALFIGLYAIGGTKPLNDQEFWHIPAYREMRDSFGMRGFQPSADRQSILFFNLQPLEFYSHWKGKLVIRWPPPERSWWRRAHRNEFPVLSIAEESALDEAVPAWDKIILTWEELGVLPNRWRSALSQWRGIYFIFDTSDSKGYVGSAYGADNLLGRWRNYGASGHGGNRLLRDRDPHNFQFSILQRVSPDMEPDEVIQLESSWKERLHTRAPFGLNDN